MNSIYLSRNNPMYPGKLLIHLQNPEPIYYRGRYELLERKSIAIVGSRKSTAYGRAVARNLAKRAAEYGVTVISGLALGIDGEAHRGVLDAGGDTVAVVANGIDICYPPSHRSLQKRILDSGLIISECPDGTEPRAYTFPKRNRIIAALADAVVVVEAAVRSGSLITAECAVEQGKILYAVPGNITSEASLGTNKLIRDGAEPLIVLDDVFKGMGLISPELESREDSLGEDEKRIITILKEKGNMSIDELTLATGFTTMTVNGIITVLEMKGLLEVEMGRAILI